MSFLPDDLRSADLVWLLDVDWLGREIRLAERLESAPFGEHGASVDYLPGLDMGGSVDQALDLFSDSSSLPSVSVTMNLAGIVNVPEEIAKGRDFSAAKGTLSLWARGEGEEKQHRIVVVSGRFRAPEYGDANEPITATLEELPATEPDLIPHHRARITTTTWADAAEDALLQWYPQILGSPGAGATWGSVGMYIGTVGDRRNSRPLRSGRASDGRQRAHGGGSGLQWVCSRTNHKRRCRLLHQVARHRRRSRRPQRIGHQRRGLCSALAA